MAATPPRPVQPARLGALHPHAAPGMAGAGMKPQVHILGGGMLGDSWHWIVTVGRVPNRREVASGRALTRADAQRDAAAAAKAVPA